MRAVLPIGSSVRSRRTVGALGAMVAVLLAAGLAGGQARAGAERATSALPLGQVIGTVDGGNFHTCGVQTSRTVACWGRNDLGQATAPAGTFADVSAGGSFTCGLKTDATIVCWGKNDVGQATAPA